MAGLVERAVGCWEGVIGRPRLWQGSRTVPAVWEVGHGSNGETRGAGAARSHAECGNELTPAYQTVRVARAFRLGAGSLLVEAC